MNVQSMFLYIFQTLELVSAPRWMKTPSSPSLVLGRPSDKTPVYTDRLAHHVLTVEPFHGCLSLFVRLILNQCITLGTEDCVNYCIFMYTVKSNTSVIGRTHSDFVVQQSVFASKRL